MATLSDTTGKQYAVRDPDVRFMLRVQQDDDPGAFAHLMETYQGRVLALLEHLLGDPELAEDLTQETFLRVYRSRKTYLPSAKFSTWLFTIVNNLALNAARSRGRRREVAIEGRDSGPLGARPLEQLAQVTSGQLPARQLEKAELRDMVRHAVEALGERQRMAMLLNKFEQMSYADIGEVMGMSPMAIKSLLSRARSNLREILEPYMNADDRRR
ncbi:MAG: RNA polymerase sigma factor [Pirellulales bacterium]